ncbi:SLBB domain-containing protein [Actinosynnema sp.]|uniref:SLBB domain-containing protein n=1 Tax=Actinosynnema sp. TaxID=1872144 RepID=UPI003F83A11E
MTAVGAARKLPERALGLAGHLEAHGPLRFPPDREAFVAGLAAAGLVGRGGGGFPAHLKAASVVGARVVVANGCEGDPLSGKDRALLERAPHLVLDGLVVTAAAVGAPDAVVAAHDAPDGLLRALAERTGDPVPVRLVLVPGGYVASEESALANFLLTGRALPVVAPPRPAGRGVLVHNAETLADVALVARWGGDGYRERATRLVTVAGDVREPGVREAPIGATAEQLVELAGGGTEELSALLVGGCGGRWVRPGATPVTGTAVVAALGASACGVRETARVLAWLSGESTGRCGPCRFGLPSIAEDFAALSGSGWLSGSGAPDGAAPGRLSRRLPLLAGRGGGAPRVGAVGGAARALEVFAFAVGAHRAGGCGGAR